MSAMTLPRVVTPLRSLHGAIGAETVKLSSLRSMRWGLAAAFVIVVVSGHLGASVAVGDIAPPSGGMISSGQLAMTNFDPVAVSMIGVTFAALVLGACGVMSISGEFSSGLMRVTALSTPRRWRIILAKVVVLTTGVLVVAMLAVLLAFYTSQPVLNGRLPSVSLADPDVARALWGNGLYLVAATLLGLALGTLVRSTAIAVTGLVSLLLILPGLLNHLLPDQMSQVISPYLPSSAAVAFTTIRPDAPVFTPVTGDVLSPTLGALVLATWVVFLMALALVTLSRRDL